MKVTYSFYDVNDKQDYESCIYVSDKATDQVIKKMIRKTWKKAGYKAGSLIRILNKKTTKK